jgi:hypothetical protein
MAPLTREDTKEADICFICASEVEHNSVAPCNHRTCHICALRLRALYKNKDCPHCRVSCFCYFIFTCLVFLCRRLTKRHPQTEAPYVIFTDDATKRFEDYSPTDFVNSDDNIGIKYAGPGIVEDTLLLLRYNCPDESCDFAGLGWPDLHRHVRSVHHRKMCDLCTRNKKVFTHEHELFTDKELERHMKKGDDNPGAIDQSGFRGHPLCGFCGERFYGDDELYVHCRAKHERCFICDRRDGSRPQYYLNYDSLEQHFKKDHFLCLDRECLEKKFVVFQSEIDLKAHQLQEHGSTLSKDVRRDARVVDMSSFDYRQPYIQERRGGGSQRENRGRGRGRDPNAEALPVSSAQPLRRDEQAFQRQMAIHSAQSVSTRTFGGQLTSTTPAAPARGSAPTSQQTSRPNSNVDHLASQISGLDLAPLITDLTPAEQARRLRHSAVIDRASTLLQNDASKLNSFRNSISSYKNSAISAAGLINAFFALFTETSSSSLGSLIRDVADLYEDPVKAEGLRTAWNDWRAINEDYPSLPLPGTAGSSSLPLGWAQVTSSVPQPAVPQAAKKTARVLKLKSSTAQSSRSSQSRKESWGSAAGPSGASSSSSAAAGASAFPTLPRSSATASSSSAASSAFPSLSGPSASALGPRPGAAIWASSSSASAPARPTQSAPTSRPASRGPPSRPVVGRGGDAFPALPPAPKPQTTLFGYGTGMVRRDFGAPSGGTHQWGAGGSGNLNGGGEGSGGATSEGEPSKRKGNKGKKQVLVQWG